MRKSVLFLIVCVFICYLLTCSVSAASADAFFDYGYYNSTIFFQSGQLSARYQQPLADAINAWKTTSVSRPLIGRDFVINTLSSSYIRDCEFAHYPDLWLNSENEDLGVYKSISELAYACPCHKSTAFTIHINNEQMPQDLPENANLFYVKSRGAIAHELGHALGLNDHAPSLSTSIMRFKPDFTIYWQPQPYDIDNANTSWAPHQ